MKAILTVVGKDQVGIVSKYSSLLAKNDVNILDLTQKILDGYFTMMLIVDLNNCSKDISTLQKDFENLSDSLNLKTQFQSEEIFNQMHRL